MQTSTAPLHSTLPSNFHPDQALIRSVPTPAPSCRDGLSGSWLAPSDSMGYAEVAPTFDSRYGMPLNMPLRGMPQPDVPTMKDATTLETQPRGPVQAAPEQGGGPGKRATLACVTCRSRKVRCDGARPSCSNCRQRHCAATCNYDEAPRRRGPDRKPGRIRGPSGSLASLEKKKQVRKQMQRDSGKSGLKATSSRSPVPLQIPPTVAEHQETYVNVHEPPKLLPLEESIVSHKQELGNRFPPAAVATSMPVSRIFTSPTTTSGTQYASHADYQDQQYHMAEKRQNLSTLPKYDVAYASRSFLDNRTRPLHNADYATTSDISSDARQRSRPSLHDLLLPSPNPPSISSPSSYFHTPSSQDSVNYQSYALYPQSTPDFSLPSSYPPSAGMREPRRTYLVQVLRPAGEKEPYAQEWVIYDKDQPWNVTHYQPYQGANIKEWDSQDEVSNHSSTSNLRYGRTPHSLYTSAHSIVREPSLYFSFETWWDNVLFIYGTDPTSISLPTYSLQSISPHGSRHDAVTAVSRDVYGFFKIAANWLSFINVPMFFSFFHHTEYRAQMQPALILSILAYFTFLQTSGEAIVTGEGTSAVMLDETEQMWKKSVMLRELAQSAFDASYNAGRIDTPLAQAAWILTLYEISGHRDTSSHRMESSMILLDNVIHVLGLKTLDSGNPRVHVFSPGAVPALGRPRPDGLRHQHIHSSQGVGNRAQMFLRSIEPSRPTVQYQATTAPTPFDQYRFAGNAALALSQYSDGGSLSMAMGSTRECPCHALSLAGSSEAQKSTPLWLSTPRWDSEASWAEIRKEEARRLVWSTVSVLGGDAAARVALGWPQLDLHAAKPENYALMLPGEELYASRPEVDVSYSGKESTWALYGRTMLLWYACVAQIAAIKKAGTKSFRDLANGGLSFTPEQLAAAGQDHADFAMRAWMETLAIEQALNEHTCDGEKATMYQAREHLFLIQMFISGGFRQYIPQPRSGVDFSRLDREKALQWLHHQANVAKQLGIVMNAEHSPARYLLIKRPYIIWWQMNLMARALQLWHLDHSLTYAVDVALDIFPVLKWFEKIWPCPEQQRRGLILRSHLAHVCGLLGKKVLI